MGGRRAVLGLFIAALAPATASADSCAGQPFCGYSAVTALTAPSSPKPNDVAVDSAGRVYLTQGNSNTIFVIAPDGSLAGLWASAGTEASGIAIDAAQNVYVTNTDIGTVTVSDTSGNSKLTIGAQGSGPGQLTSPGAVAVGAGNVYVLDQTNGLQSFSASTGAFEEKSPFGAVWLADVGVDGAGNPVAAVTDPLVQGPSVQRLSPQLASPTVIAPLPRDDPVPSVVVDGIGDVYVADAFSDVVFQFDVNGNLIRAIGGFGSELGSFNQPGGMAVDESGNLYVADFDNSRVQRFAMVPAASATLPSATAPVSGGRAPIRLRCAARGTAACAGTLRVVSGGRTVGARTYRVRNGRTAVLPVQLAARARQTLAKRTRLRVRVHASTRQPNGSAPRTTSRRHTLTLRRR